MTGISLSPPLTELTITQDQSTASAEIVITNNSSSLQALRLSTIDFGSLDNSGGIAFLGQQVSEAQNNPYALASWLQPNISEFTLSAGEKKIVTVSVKNDEHLGPGGHYGAILVKSKDQGVPEQGKVALNQALSSLILVKKTGGERYVLELGGTTLRSSLFLGPQHMDVAFKNAGNVHLTPRGVVLATDPLGRQVFKEVINRESALVLPGAERKFSLELRPVARMFIPGVYTTTVEYRYDGSAAISTTSVRTFSLGIYATVLLILVFGVTLWSLFRLEPVQLWMKRKRRLITRTYEHSSSKYH